MDRKTEIIGQLRDAALNMIEDRYAAGFKAGLEAAAKACEEGCVQIGCTALEAEGVVRRARDALAAAIRALPGENNGSD